MKSMKSEDLSKDLQVNLRISPQTQGFHDELDEKSEIKELDPKQTQIYLYSDLCSERASFQKHNYISDLSMKVGQTEIV